MQKIGHHYFISEYDDEVSKLYFDKIEEFHAKYTKDLLLYSLISLKNENFVKNVDINEDLSFEYVDLLNHSLRDRSPIIEVEHIHNFELDSALGIHYLNDFEDIEGFFMTQILTDLDDPNKSHYQLWRLGDANLYELNNHWHWV